MVSAVVLAAGAATRFGSPKQLLLLPYVLAGLQASPIDEVVIVSGAYEIPDDGSLDLEGARVVTCPDWARGPGASLRCGLAALDPSAEYALIVLADGPGDRPPRDRAGRSHLPPRPGRVRRRHL